MYLDMSDGRCWLKRLWREQEEKNGKLERSSSHCGEGNYEISLAIRYPEVERSAHLTIVTTSPLNAKQIATMDNSRIKLRRTNKIEDLLRTDMLNLSMMWHCLGVGYEGLREDLRLREKTKGTNGGGRPALAKEMRRDERKARE